MFAKNDKIELDIIDMTKDGLGIAKINSQVFFVKDALVGDKVSAIITKAEVNNRSHSIIFAKKIEVIKKSEYRMETKCKVSDACGGCQVMGLSYDKQLLLKENFVKNDLMRIGGFTEDFIEERYEGIEGMDSPYHFRNKMQVPFAVRDGKVISGFYAGRTHYIVENDECVIGFNEANILVNIIKDLCCVQNNVESRKNQDKNGNTSDDFEDIKLTVYDERTCDGILREVMIRKGNKSNEISLTLIVNDKALSEYKNDNKINTKIDKDALEKIVSKYKNIANIILERYDNYKDSNKSKLVTITLNVNTEKNNVLFGKTNIVLYGDGYIEDELCGLKFRVSPESFYQINNVQTEKLYNIALDFVSVMAKDKKIENAMDLYCGIGTITLLLSRKVEKILGIEIVDKAVKNAIENAKLNGIGNADFECMDTGDIKIDKNEKYDLISVDPPRKGLDKKTIEFVKEVAPNNILYISCDPATLSRDLKILCDKNSKMYYNIERIKCVDMFPHTMHIETVVLLSRVKG